MVFIGNQTSCWAPSPTTPFDYAMAEHFDAFEWFPDKKPQAGWDETDLDAKTRAKLKQMARECSMRVSVHVRWQVDPFRPDARELLAKDIELARDLGAALLNVHLSEEQGVPAFLEAIQPLLTDTAEAGLQLSIENTPHHSPELFNELFARLHDLSSVKVDHIGMCLDVGHANLAAATLNDYLGFYDRLDPFVPIIHVHLHENWGDSDSHLPVFTGPSGRDDSGIRGLVKRLKQRKFTGSIILEQWPQPPSLLKEAQTRLLEIWGPTLEQTTHTPPKEQRDDDASRKREQAKTAISGGQDQFKVPRRGFVENTAADEFETQLVEANQRARSWREKLEAVSQLLSKQKTGLTQDALVSLAVYLQFLGSGQIACEEDGRHFRPAHHARLASDIHERLTEAANEENEFILRKIYARLPSFSSEFRRAEPLTRIRDIAHRNDIDSELKREIKTTLQNKLHRCAGPEDLVTSAALLDRITAPGTSYPAEFVQQFKIFHEELKEFFSAHSLEQRLAAVKPLLEDNQAELVESFLQQKAADNAEQRRNAFDTLTRLRQGLAERRHKLNGSELQAAILADIGLEDFAFVLLSQIINDLERSGPRWEGKLLLLALENLELGGVEVAETKALESEVSAWTASGFPSQREQVLRFRASLLRCRRLAEGFGAWIISLFSTKAESLGHALGVDEHAIRVFCESTIRSHLVFQVSKLVEMLLSQIRQQLGLSAWDVLVGGRVAGRAMTFESLEITTPDSQKDSRIVALVQRASGDEEIPKNVVGIALAHELPHLSHLAVRARQASVVFVTCEDPAEFASIRKFQNQTVALAAAVDKVSLEPAQRIESNTLHKPGAKLRLPQVNLSPAGWIPLEEATTENAGAKAYGARCLGEIGQQQFCTPAGLVVPYGAMEAALNQTPELGKQYRELACELEGLQDIEFLNRVKRLHELVKKLNLPSEIINEARRRFTSNLVVRSSANDEDLPDFAGAGLYESIINVPPAQVEDAVRQVWASLWTARAAQSRRSARVPHDQAHMAVLIQELIDAEFSFVLHTVNPATKHDNELYAEIVVGLGETLVSGASAGTPYRLMCTKDSETVEIQAFGNFSHAARPAPEGGICKELLDYSKIQLSRDAETLKELGRKLRRMGTTIEQVFGRPQDVEGALIGGRIYVVQARPQQGLTDVVDA